MTRPAGPFVVRRVEVTRPADDTPRPDDWETLMPKLGDTLGAILRDIAQSRIQADRFSRDASLEYAKDPILRLFPVPRAEIRSAEIELVFAVDRAVEKPGVSLDVLVTAAELAKVPEAALARVKLVVEIGNYEWVEGEDENGKPVDRLTER
jgi:hypothetical protein